MLWDMHMHSHFSGDSDAKPEDMISAAEEKNLSGICFTEHLDIDYPEDPNPFLLDFENYTKNIRELAQSSSASVSVRTGIELGLQPHLSDKLNTILDSHHFDFVIGSTHVVNGFDPYYPEYYSDKTEAEAYQEYFSTTLENIYAFDNFDVYGHIDYIVRYGPNKNQFYSYSDYQDIIDEILKALIARQKGIEINTGGFKYGLGHPNPTEDILKRYCELGGEIITIGSDAHTPEHVAYDFKKVPEILKDAGFLYFTIFKDRKAEFVPLP